MRSLLLECFMKSSLRLFALMVFLIWHDDVLFLLGATYTGSFSAKYFVKVI